MATRRSAFKDVLISAVQHSTQLEPGTYGRVVGFDCIPARRVDELAQKLDDAAGFNPLFGVNPLSGYSSGNVNIWGDSDSIRQAASAFHNAAQIPHYQRELIQARAQIRQLSEELNAYRRYGR